MDGSKPKGVIAMRPNAARLANFARPVNGPVKAGRILTGRANIFGSVLIMFGNSIPVMIGLKA